MTVALEYLWCSPNAAVLRREQVLSGIIILAELIAPFMLDSGGNKSALGPPAISCMSSSLLSTDHALGIAVAVVMGDTSLPCLRFFWKILPHSRHPWVSFFWVLWVWLLGNFWHYESIVLCWSCCFQNNYSKCWLHMMQLNYWLVQFGPTKDKSVVLCTDFLENWETDFSFRLPY